MEVTVTINTNKNYAKGLKARLDKAKVSQNQLAAAMRPPRSPTQVSRWFTLNESRRVSPGFETVVQIEEAFNRILKARDRAADRADRPVVENPYLVAADFPVE